MCVNKEISNLNNCLLLGILLILLTKILNSLPEDVKNLEIFTKSFLSLVFTTKRTKYYSAI